MTVKELKKILSEQDESNEVIFYNLDNYNLTEFKLETIIDVDNRCEITTYNEQLEESEWEMKLEIETKNVYGNDLIYPKNETAQKFAVLLKKKTLTIEELKLIKELGFSINQVTKGLDIWNNLTKKKAERLLVLGGAHQRVTKE